MSENSEYGQSAREEYVEAAEKSLSELRGILYRQAKTRFENTNGAYKDEERIAKHLSDREYFYLKYCLSKSEEFSRLPSEEKNKVLQELGNFSSWFNQELDEAYGNTNGGIASEVDSMISERLSKLARITRSDSKSETNKKPGQDI